MEKVRGNRKPSFTMDGSRTWTWRVAMFVSVILLPIGCQHKTSASLGYTPCRQPFYSRSVRSGTWPPRGTAQYLYVGSSRLVKAGDRDWYLDGSIDAFPIGSATSIGTIDSGPLKAIAVDSRYIYAAQMTGCKNNGLGAMFVYDKRTGSLLHTVRHGIAKPKKFVFDRHGNVYVDNSYGPIAVYSPGGERLLRTVSEGVQGAVALAFDSGQNLYVANAWRRHLQAVTVYRNGGVRLWRSIDSQGGPLDLALDMADNLYVASSDSNSVTVYAAGSDRILRVIRRGMAGPHTLGISRGSLYVGDGVGSVGIYALASGKLVRKIPGDAQNFAFDGSGRVYFSEWKTVEIYSQGGVRHLRTLDEEGASVAIDPQ
jgi:hypothetical protein